MKTTLILTALGLLLVADHAAARQEKSLVCHVGNQLGSQGETWLENPNCDIPEGWEGEYTCPDAGKVDLIVVANAHRHLENPGHSWDGLSDYDPEAVGARADSTEDLNGDGIDDGCEIPSQAECPCWDEAELLAVTAENQYAEFGMRVSCVGFNIDTTYNGLITNNDRGGEVEGGFSASLSYRNNSGRCATRDYDPVTGEASPYADRGAMISIQVSGEEARACVDQIYARCAEIGTPIDP